MSAAVYRVRNPAALPLLAPLIEAAFARGPATPEAVQSALPGLMELEELGLFVGIEEGQPQALAIVLLPTSALFPLPQVFHFYSNGSRALVDALTDSVVDLCRSHGHTGLHAANMTGRANKLWTRLFERAGKATRVGTAFRIDFK